MAKEIEIERAEIVKGKVVRTKYTKSFSDDQVRHCDWCTMCGWSTYPECIKQCRKLNDEERKAGLELL